MASNSHIDNYYALLGVSDFAELESIREAYRKLALQLHPDKNSSSTATEDFQKLSEAWETLRDPSKRAHYDRLFARTRKRKRNDEEKDSAANQSNSEFRANKQSRKENPIYESPHQERIRVFRSLARTDYLSRLSDWIRFRNEHDPVLLESQSILQKFELDLEQQTREDDADVLQKFSEAIERLPGQHRTGTLPKLIEARIKYIERLNRQIKETRILLKGLFLKLEERTRSYEQEEYKSREFNIQQALLLAGTQDLHGSKDRAFTAWRALSRVKFTSNKSDIVSCIEPWHKAGEWIRESKECDCDRCGQSAYHFISECGAAKCRACSMVICDACYRDIRLLQEYEAWLTGNNPVDSLFSLDFEACESIDPGRGYRHDYGIKKVYESEEEDDN